jgi:hypothetical protein
MDSKPGCSRDELRDKIATNPTLQFAKTVDAIQFVSREGID